MHVVNADAFAWLEETHDLYDFAVVDFPDPSNFSIGKLYTTAFYGALVRHLPPDGRFVVQSTSPLFARQSFWCIVADGGSDRPRGVAVSRLRAVVRRVGLRHRRPERRTVSPRLFLQISASSPLDTLPELFTFPPDMQRVPVEPNHLNTQVLVRYYEQEWDGINR